MCPACCFKWHASRRRKASGVLGSPTGLLVADGQARIQFRLAGSGWRKDIWCHMSFHPSGIHQFKSEGVDECLQYGVVFYHPRKNHLRRVFHQQEVGDVQSLTALSVGRHLLQQVRACGTPAHGPFNICSVWHHLCAEASVRQRLCARGHIKGCISDGLRNRFFAVLRMTKGTQNDKRYSEWQCLPWSSIWKGDGKEKELRFSQLLDSESAPEPGLEPGTLWLTVRCSNQLSYSGIFMSHCFWMGLQRYYFFLTMQIFLDFFVVNFCFYPKSCLSFQCWQWNRDWKWAFSWRLV